MENMCEKPHAVFVPFPSQGHVGPMLKLAMLLHFKGFHITFVNTEWSHQRFFNKSDDVATPDDHFRFETIPDGLPPSDARQDIVSLTYSTSTSCAAPFWDLLARLNCQEVSKVPPVTCVITDVVMSFTIQVSRELGIPNVFFWTTGACGFLGFKLCIDLMNRGITPFEDSSYLTNGSLDAKIDWISGLSNIQLKDVPCFIRTTNRKDYMLEYIKVAIERTAEASAVIVHTFDALEREVLDILSTMFNPIYAIGPLHQLLVNQIPEEHLKSSINCNLWSSEEDGECLRWLDSKEQASVLYLNFGSLVMMEPHQILELAWGVANSKQNFLWIIRPNMAKGSSSILPPDFVSETKDRGLIASWCSQEQVLNHPAVGGFVTHSGWNSTIESVASGVPMLCLPFNSEQPTNCKYVTTEWCIGLEIDTNMKRGAIEKLVHLLMAAEEGNKMKKMALQWKKKAIQATGPSGSSFLNVEKLVNEVLL